MQEPLFLPPPPSQMTRTWIERLAFYSVPDKRRWAQCSAYVIAGAAVQLACLKTIKNTNQMLPGYNIPKDIYRWQHLMHWKLFLNYQNWTKWILRVVRNIVIILPYHLNILFWDKSALKIIIKMFAMLWLLWFHDLISFMGLSKNKIIFRLKA